MDKLSAYASNQRTEYDRMSATLEDARATIGPNFDELETLAPVFADYILAQFFQRRARFTWSSQDLSQLSLLDFGCGIGRMMLPFARGGVAKVDGADISQAMIDHAAKRPELRASSFFLTNGLDLGAAASGAYDIVYSFLCLHHIPMRQTRIRILEQMARVLKDDGMVFVELKIYPGATAARIPHNHAHWSENVVAEQTNSAADVWITPDALGMVYDDLRLSFCDVSMTEVDDPQADFHRYQPDAIYQYPFNQVFFAATKKPLLERAIGNAAAARR